MATLVAEVRPEEKRESRLMPPFAALRAFEAVGRTGGLRRAALDLSVDHAVISRHIRALEAWVGFQLVERTQTGGRLTEAGHTYHARISAAFAEIVAATNALMRPSDAVSLKIWCIHGFASHWMAHRLGEFTANHPMLDIEVQATDVTPNIPAREADADIRYLYGTARPEERATGVRSIEIARPIVVAVASPAFVEAHGPISIGPELLNLPLLHKKNGDQWHDWLIAQGIEPPASLPGLRLWHNHITIEAAQNGQGIALANLLLVKDHLRSGRLVRLDQTDVSIGAYFFTVRSDRWQEPSLAALRKWLVAAVNAD
jgi:DNA-binding transcriptional LysR family regulator